MLGGRLVRTSVLLLAASTAACTPNSSVATDPPSIATEPQTLQVSRGDLASVLVLEGAIVADPAIPVESDSAGVVTSLNFAPGDRVAAGASLLVIDGPDRDFTVTAPADGVIADVQVVAGEAVQSGVELLLVAPNRYQVVVPVDAVHLYRLYEPPLSIEARIDRGPGPFDCAYLELGAEIAPGLNPLEAPVYLRCRVPDNIRAFSGLRADVAITTGLSETQSSCRCRQLSAAQTAASCTSLRTGARSSSGSRSGLPMESASRSWTVWRGSRGRE